MSLEKRINAFVELGSFLTQFSSKHQVVKLKKLNNQFFSDFDILMNNQKPFNGWFTPDNVAFAVESVAKMLKKEDLNQWLSNYTIHDHTKPKRVGVVMAGNIPLVGFHDFLTVLITGNVLVAKTSKEDNLLIKKIAEILIAIEPDFKNNIVFTDKLENFDAVIATGSNNTARYFEYYFGKYPNIIRKNRNSVAVLTGNETATDLVNLGKDIFQYFGLGCRNVSKLYVPKDYSFNLFFESILTDYQDVVNNNKYANNYDYNKAVFLMSNFQILDNEFMTIKEDSSYSSPISSVFYEFYENLEDVKTRLQNDADQIQCIVSNDLIPNSVAFGQTQQPKLWDYADNVDTLAFLISL